MVPGNGMVVDFGADGEVEKVVVDGKWEPTVRYLRLEVKDCLGLSALLMRPDGVVTWVAEEGMEIDVQALRAALTDWSV